MTRTLPALAAVGCLATLLACPNRTSMPQTPPPSPPPVSVPPGCEASQAGTYHHADAPGFRYVGEDDGGTLSLVLLRTREDGGVEADAGDVSILLRRTPQGFVGQARGTAVDLEGAPCPVSFPTEAVACDDAGLTLRAVARARLDEACRPMADAPPPVWREQRLLRDAPDAGP